MAYVRKVKTSAGNLCWYLVDDAGKSTPCGSGAKGARLAEAALGKYKAERYAGKVGLSRTESTWTLADLKQEDLKEAKRLGLATADPQPNGVISYRETQWNQILGMFEADTLLDEIDLASIVAATHKRFEAGIGPATVNRNLSVLRKALSYARSRPDSGYEKDPFAKWKPNDEKKARRKAIVLTQEQKAELLAFLRENHPAMANSVELLMLTASRSGQQAPEIVGGEVVYAAQKKGLRRSFTMGKRLEELMASPRAWSREAWDAAREALGIDIRPHDLRHTEASLEFLAGATVEEVQRLLGHTTPAMAQRLYIHLFPKSVTRRNCNDTAISISDRRQKAS